MPRPRRLLGYSKHDGQWMTADQWHALARLLALPRRLEDAAGNRHDAAKGGPEKERDGLQGRHQPLAELAGTANDQTARDKSSACAIPWP